MEFSTLFSVFTKFYLMDRLPPDFFLKRILTLFKRIQIMSFILKDC